MYYHPESKPPRLPDDLKGKKIILIGGYSYWHPISDWLADSALNLKVTRTSRHTSAIAMLLRKRGDYLFDYLDPVRDAQQKLGLDELSLPNIILHSVPNIYCI